MTKKVLNAVTATTSAIERVENVENITVHFVAASISSGNGVLTILGSNDGTNFLAIAFADPTAANTNAQGITRITSKTLSTNTSALVVVENAFKFQFLKFTVTVTTDGAYSVTIGGDKKAVK